jgi:2-polyprenyl-3-methyl-5-hydroxy-6-metoxy-1,4-benzoquinol methylase
MLLSFPSTGGVAVSRYTLSSNDHGPLPLGALDRRLTSIRFRCVDDYTQFCEESKRSCQPTLCSAQARAAFTRVLSFLRRLPGSQRSHDCLWQLAHSRYNRPVTIYGRYAEVYDSSGQVGFSLKMIPYLRELLRRHPAPGRSMLDLACGTGTVALAFAQQGWEVYGIDGSSSMLDQARNKARETSVQPAFSQQDMRAFILPRAVDLVTCLYDSLNYMLTLDDLAQVFHCVGQALRPGSLFMADMNTQEMLEHIWDNNTFFVEGRDLAIVMQSHYEPDIRLSTVRLTGFVRQATGLYDRFDESHVEAAYDSSAVRQALQDGGFRVEAAYECFAFDPAQRETHRVMWVARRVAAQA